MDKTKLRQIIREEVRNVLKESTSVLKSLQANAAKLGMKQTEKKGLYTWTDKNNKDNTIEFDPTRGWVTVTSDYIDNENFRASDWVNIKKWKENFA